MSLEFGHCNHSALSSHHEGCQCCFGVSAKWVNPYVFWWSHAFGVPVIASSTLGGSEVNPVSGLVAVAGISVGVNECFEEVWFDAIVLVPVL